MIAEIPKDLSQKPINILLVEDNEADIKITLRAFERGKIKNNIFTVKNGQEALDFIHKRGSYENDRDLPVPDLILMDIVMPKMSGLETLQKLKEDPEFDHIPVVMLTSSKNENDVVKSYKYGAVSYIPKPVNYEDFIKIIDGFNLYWHIINILPTKLNEG